MNKTILQESLPISENDLTIRAWTREDVTILADWPSYPSPYANFNLAVHNGPPEAQEQYWISRSNDENRVTLIVDGREQRTIGLFILVGIDWTVRRMDTMGIRIHPDWCNKGVGSQALQTMGDWALREGFDCLRLDVSALNPRAVRCYEKAGFRVTGELWRDAEDLRGKDLELPENAHLKPHFRYHEDTPQTRFWWMERQEHGFR